MNAGGKSPFSTVDAVISRSRTRTSGGFRNIDNNKGDWRSIAGIADTRNEYLIRAELPDIGCNELHVSVNDGRLTIISEKKLTEARESATQYRVNSSCKKSWRSFTLPDDVDEKRISAETVNGELTVHLPKTKVKKPKVTKIPVQIFGLGRA